MSKVCKIGDLNEPVKPAARSGISHRSRKDLRAPLHDLRHQDHHR